MAGANRRRRWLGVLLMVTAVSFGCNPVTTMYFLIPGMHSDPEAPFHLAKKPKKGKEVKVVVLTYARSGLSPDFLGVDRTLANLFAKKLTEGAEMNGDKIAVVPAHDVEKYKRENPGWKAEGAAQIGKYFDADYVIDMEINSLSLYEPGSAGNLLQGRASVGVTVTDVANPDDQPFAHPYNGKYPRFGSRSADMDGSVDAFRQSFLNRIATDLSWIFVSHSQSDETHCDRD